MMMKMTPLLGVRVGRLMTIVALILLALGSVPTQAATEYETSPSGTVNLVKDGGFEEPLVPSGSSFTEWNAGQVMGAWFVAAGNVDLERDPPGWQPAEGAQSVDMNGDTPGTIYQDIPTTPGRSYLLRFAIAGNTSCAPNLKTMQVSWSGAVVATVTFDDTGDTSTNMGWTFKTYEVSAATSTTQLQFASLTQNSWCGPTLDAVSVTESNNLVQDSGFEAPPAPANWYAQYNAGQNIGPWTVASGSVKVGTVWQAAEGVQSVDLNGTGAGAIYQDIPTSPGQAYDLRFAVAADPFCPPTTKAFQVLWDGTKVATLNVDGAGKTFSNMGWTDRTFSVTATGASSRLAFASQTEGACGPAIDDVSVVPGSPPPPPQVFFEDNFDGTALNPANWNTSIVTNGARWCTSLGPSFDGPGTWQDLATQPCEGVSQTPPNGTIQVGNGLATFSSNAPHAFPYIWRGGPSLPAPFPASDDFTFTARVRYKTIEPQGEGIQLVSWSDTTPLGNNPPSGQDEIFWIWADTALGLRVQLGSTLYPVMTNANAFHTYKLEYVQGTYSIDVDGSQIARVAATGRPNTIWIGNPVAAWYTTNPWGQFDVDYVRVTVP